MGIFQTKTHYREPSDVNLIRNSAEMLADIAKANPQTQYHLNYPGIGFGRLTPEQVRPHLKSLEKLDDITLIIVVSTRPEG